MADKITVTVEPFAPLVDTPAGPAPVDHKISHVFVTSSYIKQTRSKGKLQVGVIGNQEGAAFCPQFEFERFTPDQKADIVAQVVAIRCDASPVVPPAIPPIEATMPLEGDFCEE